VVNHTVYIGSNDGHVYALDANKGTEQWRFQTNKVYRSPVVVDGTVYVGSDEGEIYALVGEEAGAEIAVYPRCPECEADLSEYGDVDFCPECGTEKTPQADCVSCGTDLSQYGGVDFCPVCGAEQ
jgi:predicted RNA-binding Zn-ribbon protein involved in translation (DUF1610 family)